MAVYFIAEEGTERVKIGWSSNVWDRLDKLQRENDRQLILMRAIRGTYAQEWAAHQKFDHLRLAGEWFTYCDEMWDFDEPIDVGHRPRPKRRRKERLSFEDTPHLATV